jgi:hypothetical protein
MANTTFSFAKAISLTDYLPAFIQRYDKQSWPWEKIYSIKNTTNATEQVFSYAGFGQARQTGELDSIYYENMSELAATTFTVYKYTLATIFSHELLKDRRDHMPDLMKEAGSLMGDSHQFIRDVAAAAFLNRATNSSYPLWDGTELASDSRTLKSGDTFDNLLTSASITFDNVWLAITHFESNLLTQSGLYISDKPKYLVYHPSKEKEVQAVLKSNLEPGTADNDLNTIRAYGLVPIPCRFLTTTTNWAIMGERFKNDNMWFDREKPSKPPAMEDSFDLMGTKLRTYQRFAVGLRDFTYCVFNPGA